MPFAKRLSSIRWTITLAVSLSFWALGGAACRFARSDAPEWIEAHGRGEVIALAADTDGALGVGSNRRIYGYPGPYGQPWIERFPQEGVWIAAGGGGFAWIGTDGTIRHLPAGGALREVPASRDWHATSMAIGPDGALYVVSQGRAWVVSSDTLSQSVCDGGQAVQMTVGSAGIHVLRADGTVVVRGSGAECLPVAVPFRPIDLAAAGDDLAAADDQGRPWRRQRGVWQQLPMPRVYRPDSFPFEVSVRQVAMTATVLWARTDRGMVFILSDPT